MAALPGRESRRAVSKKHGHARKRRRQARKPPPPVLLRRVADSLNACEKAGIRVLHPKVAVITNRGVVVPFTAGWAARAYTGAGNADKDSMDA
jgi:hypothetical protein